MGKVGSGGVVIDTRTNRYYPIDEVSFEQVWKLVATDGNWIHFSILKDSEIRKVAVPVSEITSIKERSRV